jgi:hypothetical protein
MVYVTHIRPSGGKGHEHITNVRWRNPATADTGESSVPVMVDWIENKKGAAKVTDGDHTVDVGVVDAELRRCYRNERLKKSPITASAGLSPRLQPNDKCDNGIGISLGVCADGLYCRLCTGPGRSPDEPSYCESIGKTGSDCCPSTAP